MSARRRPRAEMIAEQLARMAMIGGVAGALVGVPSAFSLMAEPASVAAVASGGVADQPITEADTSDGGAIVRSRDGLFYVELQAAGGRQRCLVDTGATALTLSTAAAARLGLDAAEVRYTGRIVTAGGERRAGRARFPALEISGHRMTGVSAVLVRDSGTPCLIGQELLGRLDHMEIRGDELRLG